MRYEPECLDIRRHDRTLWDGGDTCPRAETPDKAKVEAGVLLVERWILAALRNQKFFSLTELNKAIREILVKLNERAFQKLPGSRKSVWEEQERPVLKPTPAMRYELAQWKQAKVHFDYHVELKWHYYSVPYRLIGQR